jgi:hypothetical protein
MQVSFPTYFKSFSPKQFSAHSSMKIPRYATFPKQHSFHGTMATLYTKHVYQGERLFSMNRVSHTFGKVTLPRQGFFISLTRLSPVFRPKEKFMAHMSGLRAYSKSAHDRLPVKFLVENNDEGEKEEREKRVGEGSIAGLEKLSVPVALALILAGFAAWAIVNPPADGWREWVYGDKYRQLEDYELAEKLINEIKTLRNLLHDKDGTATFETALERIIKDGKDLQVERRKQLEDELQSLNKEVSTLKTEISTLKITQEKETNRLKEAHSGEILLKERQHSEEVTRLIEDHSKAIKETTEKRIEAEKNYTSDLESLNSDQQKKVDSLREMFNKNQTEIEQLKLVEQRLKLYFQIPQKDVTCLDNLHQLLWQRDVSFPANHHFSPTFIPLMKQVLQKNMNGTLKNLNCYGAYLQENKGLERLMEGLKENTTLQGLNLGYTDVKQGDGTIIAAMLRENRALEEMNLYYTYLDDSDATLLLTALKENKEKKLRVLNLNSTHVSEAKKQELRKTLGITVL